LFFIFSIGIFQAQTTPEVLWAKQFGGINSKGPQDMATDPSNNIYVIGVFSNEIIFGDIALPQLDNLLHL